MAGGCAAPVPREPAPQPGLAWMLQQVDGRDPRGLHRIVDLLGVPGGNDPHGRGPTRNLPDALLHDIRGAGADDGLWFEVNDTPCYPLEELERILGTGESRGVAGAKRFANPEYVVVMNPHARAPECVSRLTIWKQRPAAGGGP